MANKGRRRRMGGCASCEAEGLWAWKSKVCTSRVIGAEFWSGSAFLLNITYLWAFLVCVMGCGNAA